MSESGYEKVGDLGRNTITRENKVIRIEDLVGQS